MTIAAAYASRGNDDRGAVGVIADSRLTYSDNKHIDSHPKTYELDERTVVVSAGLAPPTPSAAEVTRSLIAATRLRQPSRDWPLWAIARPYTYFFNQAYDDFMPIADGPTEAVIAGFHSDGMPGLVHIEFDGPKRVVHFHRPSRGTLRPVVIGEPEHVGLVRQAFADAKTEEDHDLVASVFWHLITRDEADSIGGGITAGICTTDSQRFTWPLIVIGREEYYRGFRVVDVPTHPDEHVRWELSISKARAKKLRRSIKLSHVTPPGGPTPCRTMSVDEFVHGGPFYTVEEPMWLHPIEIGCVPMAFIEH